ncbi:MAG: threonine--tRNA ligase [Candidatus Spechtbacterales bacterium]|nr:threonine--tRNA ligase [Candidatus Spechtbacterales bacterium]
MANKNEKLNNIRHSFAHVLAQAVLKFYPDAKLGIGPAIENGFYYDFGNVEISEKDLKKIQGEMKKIISRDLKFKKEEWSVDKAKKYFKEQDAKYKLDLIDELKKEENAKKVGIVHTGDKFTDLCRGGHVKSTKDLNVDAFKLMRVAGAYWRGDEKNDMLTRVYGVAFENKKELDKYLKWMEEAKKRDHKKLGKKLDLFTFSDVVGKGLPLWTEKGSVIRRELEKFIVEEEISRGYTHVYTPDIAKISLYEKSGHYPYYKESMYSPIDIDGEKFMLRPMTCPHHYELYLRKPHSYREMPRRIAEMANLYRYEQSGELSGLQRVRTFTLADAHIICRKDQAKDEVMGALELIDFAAKTLGLKKYKDYWYRLSLREKGNNEKYYDNEKAWKESEKFLRDALKERRDEFEEAEGEAAFYGPKIDIQMRNVNGKEDTAFTVQYDFVGPERFNLNYINKKGDEERAVVVHRSSIGAIERSVAFLIEKYGGAFPLWLSPDQVWVVPVSEKFNKYGREVMDKLREAGVRADICDGDDSLGKKIRNGEKNKLPYLLIVGEKEKKAGTVSVRDRQKGDEGAMKVEKFVEKIIKEVKNKK